MAAVLAMLFVVLISSLAVGFYAVSTTTVQIANNELDAGRALTAATSGMQYLRAQFGQISLSAAPGQFPVDAVFPRIAFELDGTPNMGGVNPTLANANSAAARIHIPGRSANGTYNWMNLGGQMGTVRFEVAAAGASLQISAIGRAPGSSAIERTVRYTFKPQSAAYVIPGGGVLTRSPVSLSNGAQISGGDVTSTTAQNVASLTMSGGAKLNQDFNYTAGANPPVIGNGAKIMGQVNANVTAPEFPTVDTSVFSQFVPSATAPQGPKVITATSSIASTATLTNIRIKANANTNFGNSVNLNGVIYVESPNKISFGGGVRVTGVIVTDNNTVLPLAGNQITLDNGVRIDGVENLDPATFAASERIAEVRQLAGALVIAPNYKLVLAGGARSYAGSLVASSFDISNGYKGTISGAVINLADTAFTMMGGGHLTFTGGSSSAPGLLGGTRFRLDPSSYVEVLP
ncbi:MAG TPA: hypothetical protein VEA69_14205 [Tepidisphaeraceae bacterium]|nr:hypothetical protein [Tepidisphaeraceae bacterium]